MKRIAIGALSFAVLSVAAQSEVGVFSPGVAEGVTYYLPNTVLEITVEANCIMRVPGEFSRYADRFLRINDAVTDEDKSWELAGVRVRSVGVPNREKAFTVKLDGSSASNLVLNSDGILQAINTNVDEPVVEEKPKKIIKRADARSYLTEEILQAASTAKMAELTAKEIYAIRESKIAITRGQADNMPKDGVSMQLVLDELDLQERTLTELFTGRIDTVAYTYDIRFTPTEHSDTTRAVLFRFSRKLGVLQCDDMAGAPVYYDFSSLDMHSSQATVDDGKKKKKELKKQGICCNVPGRARISIYTPSTVLYEDVLPFAQLGTVEVLSKNIFGKNSDTRVVFDTATGAVISIDK